LLPAILTLHLFLLFFIRFVAWPEMLTWPYLILKGWLPYRDIAIAHTPVLLADLAIFYKIFGVGLWQLKAYTWILILITDILIFWVARKLFGYKQAILALLFYIPPQILYEGNGVWFDLALAPFALLIFYLLRQRKYFWLGFLWALSFLTKQTAFWLLVPIGMGLLNKLKINRLKKFALGILLTAFLTAIFFLALNLWRDFYFWAIRFGIGVLPQSQGQIYLPGIRQLFLSLAPFVILVPLVLQKNKRNLDLVFWASAGLLGIFPRFELFHFQPALPFLAIGAGITLVRFINRKYCTFFITVGYLILSIVVVTKLWGKGTRFFEPEIYQTAAFIKSITSPGEAIYLINAWDNLYVLSDTVPTIRPLVPHLFWYMEQPGIQDEIVSDLVRTRPRVIIQGEYSCEGLGAYRPAKIMDFVSHNYEVSGKIYKYLIWVPKNKQDFALLDCR